MKRSPDSQSQSALPKHLLADSEDDRLFVVHLQSPRFVGEIVPAPENGFEIIPAWIDTPSGDEEKTDVLQEAANFYIRMVERDEQEAGDAY